MRGSWLNRALFAAAGAIVSLTIAAPSLAADATGLLATPTHYAGDVELPVVLPDPAVVPENVLHNPLEEITGTFAFDDALVIETGYNVDVGRMLDHYAPGYAGFDGLFYATTLGSPYADLSSGGQYVGLMGKLSEGVTVSLGQASSSPGLNRFLIGPRNAYAAMGGRLPFDNRYSNSILAAMTWNFARWGGINLTASQTAERGGVLAMGNPALGARTSALGVTAHVSFGGGWVTTASYAEGLTQLAMRPGALAPNAAFRTEAFGVAVAKHGLFKKNDALGVAFAQPAPNFGTPLTTTDKANELQFFGHDKLMSSLAQETDIELGYKTSFFGDTVALQTNAAYQMNYGGIVGRDSVSLLSKAKIKF